MKNKTLREKIKDESIRLLYEVDISEEYGYKVADSILHLVEEIIPVRKHDLFCEKKGKQFKKCFQCEMEEILKKINEV